MLDDIEIPDQPDQPEVSEADTKKKSRRSTRKAEIGKFSTKANEKYNIDSLVGDESGEAEPEPESVTLLKLVERAEAAANRAQAAADRAQAATTGEAVETKPESKPEPETKPRADTVEEVVEVDVQLGVKPESESVPVSKEKTGDRKNRNQ